MTRRLETAHFFTTDSIYFQGHRSRITAIIHAGHEPHTTRFPTTFFKKSVGDPEDDEPTVRSSGGGESGGGGGDSDMEDSFPVEWTKIMAVDV